MPETILEVASNAQFKSDYTRYGIYILFRRVLSDYRDGLKPVQRRILWAMLKNTKAITTKVKSAAVTGDVMKLYHPHGDASVYDAMVRLAQDFSMRYPLIDGHGNFGSVDGDGAAAHAEGRSLGGQFSCEVGIEVDIADVTSTTNKGEPYFLLADGLGVCYTLNCRTTA